MSVRQWRLDRVGEASSEGFTATRERVAIKLGIALRSLGRSDATTEVARSSASTPASWPPTDRRAALAQTDLLAAPHTDRSPSSLVMPLGRTSTPSSVPEIVSRASNNASVSSLSATASDASTVRKHFESGSRSSSLACDVRALPDWTTRGRRHPVCFRLVDLFTLFNSFAGLLVTSR